MSEETEVAEFVAELFDEYNIQPMPVRIAGVWRHFREEHSVAARVAFARQILDGSGWSVAPPEPPPA